MIIFDHVSKTYDNGVKGLIDVSLKINDEFNIAFSDKYYVNKLKKELFEKDFKLSKEITKPYIINWYDKVMSIFANRF